MRDVIVSRKILDTRVFRFRFRFFDLVQRVGSSFILLTLTL